MERQAEFEKAGLGKGRDENPGSGRAEYERIQKKAGRRNCCRQYMLLVNLLFW